MSHEKLKNGSIKYRIINILVSYSVLAPLALYAQNNNLIYKITDYHNAAINDILVLNPNTSGYITSINNSAELSIPDNYFGTEIRLYKIGNFDTIVKLGANKHIQINVKNNVLPEIVVRSRYQKPEEYLKFLISYNIDRDKKAPKEGYNIKYDLEYEILDKDLKRKEYLSGQIQKLKSKYNSNKWEKIFYCQVNYDTSELFHSDPIYPHILGNRTKILFNADPMRRKHPFLQSVMSGKAVINIVPGPDEDQVFSFRYKATSTSYSKGEIYFSKDSLLKKIVFYLPTVQFNINRSHMIDNYLSYEYSTDGGLILEQLYSNEKFILNNTILYYIVKSRKIEDSSPCQAIGVLTLQKLYEEIKINRQGNIDQISD